MYNCLKRHLTNVWLWVGVLAGIGIGKICKCALCLSSCCRKQSSRKRKLSSVNAALLKGSVDELC